MIFQDPLAIPSFSDPNVIIVTVSEYLAFAVLCTTNSRIFAKYRSNPTELSANLFRAFLIFTFAPIAQSLDTFFLDSITVPALGYKPSIGYATAFVLAGIANYFLLRFTYDLFEPQKSSVPKILGISNGCIVAGFFLTKVFGEGDISTIFLLGHVLISFWIFGNLCRKSFKMSKGADPITRRGFQLIGQLGVFLILMYVMFILEAIFFYGTFSIFGALGWIMALLGSIVAFAGFCMPESLKRRLLQKESDLESPMGGN